MSNDAQKKLWDKILNKTFNDLSESTKELRNDIAVRLGQIYIFDPNALKETIEEFYKGTVEKYSSFGLTIEEQEFTKNIKFPTNNFNKLVKICEDKARAVENNNFKSTTNRQGKRRLNYIKKIILGQGKAGTLPLPNGATAYVFKNYEQAVAFHKEIVRGEIKTFVKWNILRKVKSKDVKQKLEAQYNTSILNVGHGASIGASVSALQATQELTAAVYQANTAGLTQKQIKALEDLKESVIIEYAKVGLNTQAVDTTIEQAYYADTIKNFYIGKRGTLRAGYISVLSLQSTWDNNIDSQTEKNIKKDVLSKLNELKNNILVTEGSDSLLQGIEKVLFYNSSNKLKRYKNVKLKGKSSSEYRSVNKFSSSHKTSSTVKSGKTQKAQKVKPDFNALMLSKVQTQTQPVQVVEGPSPLEVVAYINTRLQQTIEENMIQPALESRTGRFSGSVKVLNMVRTRQGFPSFEYTYDKNPYQVFEMGTGRSPWATPQRDPRKLIDKSIREIAAEMLQGRLYTRRV
jgi:hypothetical protein